MNYIYPELSKRDYFFFRVIGGGIGNLLFTYGNAYAFSKMHNLQMIWPTWMSINPYTFLRNEKDKRLYNNLFKNNSNYIDGFDKFHLLHTKKKVYDMPKNEDNVVYMYHKPISRFDENLFEYIDLYREEIKNDIIRNLTPKNKKVYDKINFYDGIVVHVRIGDFTKVSTDELKNGENNARIPVSWFASMVNQIREITNKNIKVYVMSDGKDSELSEILSLDNVERIDYKISIVNMLAMTKTNFFIASGSTFSLWSRYLGQMNCITYKNQYKQWVQKDKEKLEIEVEDKIDEKYHKKIIEIFKDNA